MSYTPGWQPSAYDRSDTSDGHDIPTPARLFVEQVRQLWRDGLVRPGEAFTIIPASELTEGESEMSVNDRIAQMRRQQADLERKIAAAAMFPDVEPPAGYRAEVTFVNHYGDKRLTYLILGIDPNITLRGEREPLRWYFTGQLGKPSHGRWVRWAGLVSAFMDMLYAYDIESWNPLVTVHEADPHRLTPGEIETERRLTEERVRRLSEGGKL